ncbi:uroporphyrinogen-III C-methyltransferase [Flagellimonas sp. HMM57]|uniref:uroporphyrinogen-III C-methyltransferase n=1 Tax=unclassified Flagellimonas TaxID=2644544 RepID=UPI0013D37C88|nr:MULTISPECIES: uroporphyrinogen-III C-methyltransferase [unclassified Flagellimonas]UII77772.1 uroporphyrinogen-III C-methyltransferase [Flagellimonas sp. HMM57]
MKQVPLTPKVTLVGAGPGSKDLITIRGLKALQGADVVLYDALIDKDLLKEIPKNTLKIYVGKRCGKHYSSQEEINTLLVTYALSYGHVVRLKGGDPFVFGRASEEIDYVESFGIPVVVIPGVSSAIAVPASQGIPVTKRGASSSFWVVTATKKEKDFSKDLEFAAQSTATLVILMGVRKIARIAREIRKYRSGLTPIALIQNGTLNNESCMVATLNGIDAMVRDVDFSEPGIIVVGDVVAEHPSFFEEEVQRVLHSSF